MIPAYMKLLPSFFLGQKDPSSCIDHSLNPRKVPLGWIYFLLRRLIRNRLASRRHIQKIIDITCKRVVSKQLHGTFTSQHWQAECLLFEGRCQEMEKLFESLIQKGHTPSMAALAEILAQGMDGVKADHERMDQLLRRGMEKNCFHCMGVIASRNFNWNLRKYSIDPGVCFELARNSASRGSKYGEFALGFAILSDYNGKEAWEHFESAAGQGHAGALYKLGMAHIHGKSGYSKDVEKGFKFYKAAARRGDAFALSLIGPMLYKGECVTTNFDEAIYWLRRAVDAEANACVCHGYTSAAYHLKQAELANPHKKPKN